MTVEPHQGVHSHNNPPVVILGAGPAGLAAAWKLTEAGRPVVVLEAADAVGGLAATLKFRGQAGDYHFDFGGHRFLTRDPGLLEFVEQLLGDDLLHAERTSVIRYRGRIYDYPLALGNLIRHAPVSLLAGAARDLLLRILAAREPFPEDESLSFRDWITLRFGPTLYQHFFEGYTAKLWGVDPAWLSGDWAAQRISLIDLRDVARRLLPGAGRRPRTYARHYRYPRKGFGQIFERLRNWLEVRGVQVLTGRKVVGLVTQGDQVVGVQVRTGDSVVHVAASHVISTLPLPEVTRMLGGTSTLSFRALRFLNMPVSGGDVSPWTWQYLSDPDVMATRLQEPRRRSPDMAPAGYSSVMLEIPCNEGDECWHAEEGQLVRRAWSDLERLGVDPQRHTGEVFHARAAHAYPLMTLGYERERARNLACLLRYRNLIPCGRQGTFRYIFTDTAMEMGMMAAKSIIEDKDLRHEIVNHRNEKTVIEVDTVT